MAEAYMKPEAVREDISEIDYIAHQVGMLAAEVRDADLAAETINYLGLFTAQIRRELNAVYECLRKGRQQTMSAEFTIDDARVRLLEIVGMTNELDTALTHANCPHDRLPYIDSATGKAGRELRRLLQNLSEYLAKHPDPPPAPPDIETQVVAVLEKMEADGALQAVGGA